MSDFLYDLGHTAKDKITGFTGIIVGRIEYLTGCNQYGLSGGLDKDGRPHGTEYFDEGRIEVLTSKKRITIDQVAAPKRGGPNRDAP